MALIFQPDFAAAEEFYTLLYSHSKSLKYKNNTVGQSLFPTVQKASRRRKQWGFSPSLTVHSQAQCMVSSGSPVNLLLAAPPEHKAFHALQPWRSLHHMTSSVIPSPSWGIVQGALPACQNTECTCLIWTNLEHESPEWKQGLHEHKGLRRFQLIALERTAVATADAAFPLVQYSQKGLFFINISASLCPAWRKNNPRPASWAWSRRLLWFWSMALNKKCKRIISFMRTSSVRVRQGRRGR